MFKKLIHKIERKVIRYLLKKVLKKDVLVAFTDKILTKMENLSDKTIIDNEIALHLRDILNVPKG